jgi:dihydrofolate reductase
VFLFDYGMLPAERTRTFEERTDMRRVIMWNLITLDGYFEGPEPWDLRFHSYALSVEFEELSLQQLRSADALVFGRATYEGMAAHWSSAEGAVADLMNAVPKIVCSRTLRHAAWSNTTVSSDATRAVSQLKHGGDGDILVFGSSHLSGTLIREGLFDEYRLGVVPAAIGRGRSLFGSETSVLKLNLCEAKAMSNGCLFLRYAPERG